MFKRTRLVPSKLFSKVTNTNGLKMTQTEPTSYSPKYKGTYIDSTGKDVLFGNVYYLNTPASSDKGYHIPIGRSKFPYQSLEDKDLHAISVIIIQANGIIRLSDTSLGYANKLWVKQDYTLIDPEHMQELLDESKLLEIYDFLNISYNTNIIVDLDETLKD